MRAHYSPQVYPPSNMKLNKHFKTPRWRLLRWRLTLSDSEVGMSMSRLVVDDCCVMIRSDGRGQVKSLPYCLSCTPPFGWRCSLSQRQDVFAFSDARHAFHNKRGYNASRPPLGSLICKERRDLAKPRRGIGAPLHAPVCRPIAPHFLDMTHSKHF